MQGLLDLTHRQAVRVLEQALRTRARLELGPWRRLSVSGYLAGCEGDLLRVDLHDRGATGADAAGRGPLRSPHDSDGQMYRFSSCILTAEAAGARKRLMLRSGWCRSAIAATTAAHALSAGYSGLHAEPTRALLTISEIGLGGLACLLPCADEEC